MSGTVDAAHVVAFTHDFLEEVFLFSTSSLLALPVAPHMHVNGGVQNVRCHSLL